MLVTAPSTTVEQTGVALKLTTFIGLSFKEMNLVPAIATSVLGGRRRTESPQFLAALNLKLAKNFLDGFARATTTILNCVEVARGCDHSRSICSNVASQIK